MDIIELTKAYWRLKRWVDKVDIDKKQSAYSSLRKIEKYISDQGIQLITYDGQPYDIGLPVTNTDEDDFYNCDGAIIEQTIEPVIIRDNKIVNYGKVTLKKESLNNEETI